MSVPTLIECKLIANSESRREVVGQIIEYAANARAEWSDGRLRELANAQWATSVNEIDKLLESELGVEDVDAFWLKVDDNLAAGRIRLIIAGDHIHTNVQRMIEYLNGEMRNAEVYGLEVSCYGPDSDNVVMMTRVIGRVQAVVDKRSAQRGKLARTWGVDELKAYFSGLEDKHKATVAITLLDWGCKTSKYSNVRTVNPAFKLLSNGNNLRIGVYSTEGIWVLMSDLDAEGKQALHHDLVNMGLTEKTLEGKGTFVLEKLTPTNVDTLIDYLSKPESK